MKESSERYFSKCTSRHVDVGEYLVDSYLCPLQEILLNSDSDMLCMYA